jgi:hypothetical protein
MALLVPLILVFVFVIVMTSARSGGRNRLLTKGLLARGLILEANRNFSEVTLGRQRFEMRRLRLDIEVPGSAPYEVTATPLIPRICEALPGAALDVRVDPKNPQNIAIVGPAGSSAWLPVAAAMPGQTWAGPPAVGKGCATAGIVVVTIGMALVLATALGSSHKGSSPAHTTPTHSPPTKPGAHPAVKPGSHAK